MHRFFPENLHNNPFIPQVTLTGFQLFNEPVKLDTAISEVKQIELSHDENFFTFEFTAMDYTNPRKNQYAYKLEGLDDDWIQSGNRSQANYTNVPPGAYTFRVKGSNSDGVWNEQDASIRVIITPPFWQTGWFRLAAVLAVIAFLAALYNYRVAKLLEIERTRLRIARDLHDEIGSSLSSIALSSEFLQGKDMLNEKEKGLLNGIDATAHRVIEAMNDIVWAINPRHDKLEQLLFYMKDFAAEILAHKGIAYTFDFPEEELPQSLDMEFRRHLLLIYKELLHNIIKHAQASRVDIALTKNNGVLVLKVQDDGIGFEPKPAGNCLRNMKIRASRLGGRIEFKTGSRAGTEATLTIKIP